MNELNLGQLIWFKGFKPNDGRGMYKFLRIAQKLKIQLFYTKTGSRIGF